MSWLPLYTILRCVFAGFAGFLIYLDFDSEKPSWMSAGQEFATSWKPKLDRYPDPESALASHREIAVRRFSSNEWVYGICRDCLTLQESGAIVVKDSTGQTRVFLGQGCTKETLALMMRRAKSLDDFYRDEAWTIFQFKESVLPQLDD